MKKPIFNQIERQIIYQNKSLSADQMKLFIARKRIEKEFLKTAIGRLAIKTVLWLNKALTS